MVATLILYDDKERNTAIAWIRKAPVNCVVTFKQPGRSDIQNDRMWAMLTDVSKQAKLHGKKWSPAQWKVIFMSALKHDQEFVQGIEGDFIPAGFKSSQLSVKQMSDLMEYMSAFGAEQGVIFGGPTE